MVYCLLGYHMKLLAVSGELIADENEDGEEKSDNSNTKYQLVGVVVHSGQASGGHYFSYILHRWLSRNLLFGICNSI